MNLSTREPLHALLTFVIALAAIQIACSKSQTTAESTQEQLNPTPSSQSIALDSGIDSSRILFQDDFQAGISDSWEINNSWQLFQQEDLSYFRADHQGGAWIPGGYEWSQYVFRTNTLIENGSLFMSFNMTRQGRYMLQIMASGLYLVKEYPAGEFNTVASTGPLPAPGWHYIALGSDNGHIQVYVDRGLWIDYLDNSPLSSGTIAVSSVEGSQIGVDNVIVNQLAGSLPAGQVVAPQPLQEESFIQEPADIPVQDIDPEAQPVAPPPPPTGAEVSFTVEDQTSASIDSGQCVTTAWSVQNALEVYYEDTAVNFTGANDECPLVTTTYFLHVVELSGTVLEYQVTVTVADVSSSGASPDLRVQGVGIQPAPAQAGQALTIRVVVTNGGSGEAGPFNVVWLPEVSGFVGCSWDFSGLGAGITEERTCDYQGYPQPGQFTWEAIADMENEITESNDTNNIRQGEINIQAAAPAPPPEPVNCRTEIINPTSVLFVWGYFHDSNHEGFRLYQAGTSLEATMGPEEMSVTLDTLAPNTEYEFDVRSFNQGGESAPCVMVVTTPQ